MLFIESIFLHIIDVKFDHSEYIDLRKVGGRASIESPPQMSPSRDDSSVRSGASIEDVQG